MTQIQDYALADPSADSRLDRLNTGLDELAANGGRLARLRQHWLGTQPAAYLSAEAQAALDKGLKMLAVNFPRLAVLSLAERIRLAGLLDTAAGRPLSDGGAGAVWTELKNAGIDTSAGVVTTDRLLYGLSYATVWATETGRLTLTADSPLMMVHARDAATDETIFAVRAWEQWGGSAAGARAVLYEDDRITFYGNTASGAPQAGSGWKITDTIDNPLGVVPVVPFTRRVSASDPATGSSTVEQILDLTDAVAKLLSDAMVTSEFYARPRRWATGLEIEETPVLDDDGNPTYDDDGEKITAVVDPFAKGRHLQSEAPETKFGQLDASRLDGYSDLISTLTQQIGALTGIPPHYLGLHGDQPPSSDAVKATEIQLTTAAYTEQDRMTRPWADVAWLADAVLSGTPADPAKRGRYVPAWKSPEIRTQAQASDAAAKLAGIGVPLASLLADPLGYSPADIATITATARTDAIINGLGRGV